MSRYPIDAAYQADGIAAVRELDSDSVHLILSDIPYGIGAEEWDVLHDNTNSAFLGTSPAQERAGAVFRRRGKPINGWSEADRRIPLEYYEWCSKWASEWLRVLKPGASAIVFAGRRLSHRCVCALEDAGFSYKDTLAWLRDGAVHRAQRLSVVFQRRQDQAHADEWEGWRVGNLRPTFEPILWFTKPYKLGSTIADNALVHGVGGFNEDAYRQLVGKPENVLRIGFQSGEGGLHPTQKPLRLMEILIELTTRPGQLVLDPFCGSGTTLVAARNRHRHFVGFDLSHEYIATAHDRLSATGLWPLSASVAASGD